ncbi:MAG: hypothetical protein ACRERR_03400 [Moraxellaceae bacterium]
MPIRNRSAAIFTLMMAACSSASAQNTQSLQKCLAAFDGIVWSLPYSPRLSAGNCHSSADSADIEFFMHDVLDADERGLDYEARYAAEKKAAFAFFEQLFQRHGYRLESTEVASDSSVPHVQQAVFQRSSGERIEYSAASNVCRLKLKKAGRP